MEQTNEVKIHIKKVKLLEQSSDFGYWNSQPYSVRLDTLEQIRQEYHQWRYGAEPRLQRVFSIIKR